jgi:hypothetical protein
VDDIWWGYSVKHLATLHEIEHNGWNLKFMTLWSKLVWILNDYMDESGTHGLNWSIFNIERCGWNT